MTTINLIVSQIRWYKPLLGIESHIDEPEPRQTTEDQSVDQTNVANNTITYIL